MAGKKMKKADLQKLLKEQGIEIEDGEGMFDGDGSGDNVKPIGERAAELGKKMGGATLPEDATDDQKKALQQAFLQGLELKLYQTEKEIATASPKATEDQKAQMANAIMTGDTVEIMKISQKIHQMGSESEDGKDGKDANLRLEMESDGDGGAKTSEPQDLKGLFGSFDSSSMGART